MGLPYDPYHVRLLVARSVSLSVIKRAGSYTSMHLPLPEHLFLLPALLNHC